MVVVEGLDGIVISTLKTANQIYLYIQYQTL